LEVVSETQFPETVTSIFVKLKQKTNKPLIHNTYIVFAISPPLQQRLAGAQ